MKRYIAFFIFLLSFISFNCKLNSQVAKQIDIDKNGLLLGLGTQKIIKSKILKENRPIIISLPDDYHKTTSKYPVLYVLDGLQNIKHTVGTVELLTESGLIPPIIIVGIESLDRTRDLTPSNAGQNIQGNTGNSGIPNSGGAPKFLAFLKDELIPFVETNYRTHPYRILEGHSLGGLFSLFSLMENPELFDAFIIEAPALWWNNEEITEKASLFFKSNKNLSKTIYLGIGGGDGWGMKQELKRFVKVIKDNNVENLRWFYEEVGDEGHMASRLLLNYKGLKYLFSDLKVNDSLINNYSSDKFLKSEQQLISKYGDNVRRPAENYYDLISKLIQNNNDLGAITVLKRATEAYPSYIGLQTLLAKLYVKTNQKDKAINTYLKSIEVSKRYKLGQEKDLQKEVERLQKM